MIEQYDEEVCRCRMLGHDVPFRYCRTGNGRPCSKIFDCWYERMPVEDFIRRHYSQEEIDQILSPPKPKIVTLVELIEKAKGRV